jgi:hypothetical protein
MTKRHGAIITGAFIWLIVSLISGGPIARGICGAEAQPPLKFQFEKFPEAVVQIAKKAPIETPAGEDYSEIRDRYENSPVNFAGKYAIVRVSCGAGCETGWIVNAMTGKMYDLPTVYSLFEPQWKNFQRIDFRSTSSLLVFTGILKDEDEKSNVKPRRYYYRFDGSKLRLVASEPIGK